MSNFLIFTGLALILVVFVLAVGYVGRRPGELRPLLVMTLVGLVGMLVLGAGVSTLNDKREEPAVCARSLEALERMKPAYTEEQLLENRYWSSEFERLNNECWAEWREEPW